MARKYHLVARNISKQLFQTYFTKPYHTAWFHKKTAQTNPKWNMKTKVLLKFTEYIQVWQVQNQIKSVLRKYSIANKIWKQKGLLNSVYKVEATVSSLGSRTHMAPHSTSIIQKSGVMRDLFCARYYNVTDFFPKFIWFLSQFSGKGIWVWNKRWNILRQQLSAECTHRIGLKANFYSNSFIEEATFLANKPKYFRTHECGDVTIKKWIEE